jgi:hypothetical protein
VRRARDLVPHGSTIFEFVGPPRADHDVRFRRIGSVATGDGAAEGWTVVPIGGSQAPGEDPLRPEAEARELLAAIPACAFFYEGVPCWSEKERSEPVAPACATMSGALRLENVAEARLVRRAYDEHLEEGFAPDQRDVSVTPYRVLGRR